MRKKTLYLDYAASTPVDPGVLLAMMPYLKQEYGNPSSLHRMGQKAASALERARVQAASFLHCAADEIVFTSGATEANNLAIQGILRSSASKRETELLTKKPHVITSAIEHESVLAPIQKLEKEGIVEATYISVGKDGIVNPEDVGKAIKENTVLVSMQYANSEIGTIQRVAEIGRIIRAFRKSRNSSFPLFHTDAVQAANFLDCDVEQLHVDLCTLSSHKIYGPKGAGLLFMRKGAVIDSMLEGGSQEGGLRSGTENVAAIVGMGKALTDLQSPKARVEAVRIHHMRDQLIKSVLKQVSESACTGSMTQRLPNNAHFTFAGIEGRDLVILLDQKGIAASTGSACSERSQEPSRVLLALGTSSKEALGSLRITLGKRTTKEDIVRVLRTLPPLVDQLRKRRI